MLSLFREYSLDVWDWIVGNRYPRQVLLESLKEPDRQFPASNLRTTESEISAGGEASCQANGRAEGSANLTAETRLIKRSNIADLKVKTMLVKLVRAPSLIGIWEETHPESSVCITQLKPRPRILPAYQSEHEEF